MLDRDEDARPLIQDIMVHPFMQDFQETQENDTGIIEEMKERYEKIQSENEVEKAGKVRAIVNINDDDYDMS